MVSELAKGDWEDLRAQGLNPTLEDFDRLNCIALRLEDGAETTCANFPRVGWAGDVPFFEPTVQALEWFNRYAVRVAANGDTEFTLWAFALAHAREPHFFDALTTPEAIDKAASEWAATLQVTRDEVMRACRYAAVGFDDAEPARADGGGTESGNPLHRADATEAARNLAAVEKILARAYAKLGRMPADVQCETPSRLERLCEAAAVELGKPMKKDEARLRADYDLTLREIVLRLRADALAADKPGNAATDDKRDKSGNAVNDKIDPAPLGSGVVSGDQRSDRKAGDEVSIVKHDGIMLSKAGA